MPRKRPALQTIAKIALLLTWTAGILLLVQFLLSFPFRTLYQHSSLSSAAIQTLYSAFSYALAFFIIVFAPKKLQKSRNATPLRQTLHLVGLPTWTDLGLAPVGFVAYTILAAIITSIFSIFPWFDATESQNVGYSTIIFGPDRIFAFFALVIVAPIAEELIFRGFLYTKIKLTLLGSLPQKTSHKTQRVAKKSTRHTEIIAIIITSLLVSLLFAILHGQWNVGVNVFVMSLVLCALREITGTIYSGILMHIVKNLISFYLLFIMGSGF